MLAGVIISPTNSPPIIALSPNPSSQRSGGDINSRNCRSSGSSDHRAFACTSDSPATVAIRFGNALLNQPMIHYEKKSI